ncbi:MAG TPA: methyltransferase [Caulobacteraceae bacterium]|nr:methyltransferase [Caulobacteraceae bacterium]
MPPSPVSEHGFLGGRLRLRQAAKGYRAGADAALLAAACDAGAGERVLELGCGVGAVMLAAAIRRPEALFVGIEREVDALALALENVGRNDLGERVSVRAGDIASTADQLRGFDAVLANPPYFDDETRLRGPRPERRSAYLAPEGLGAWIVAMTDAARRGGTLTLIHRAERLGDILGLLPPKAGSIRVRPVQPFEAAPAKRVLVRAVKGGRAPLVILPPLVLHVAGGAKHTPQADAILRGEAALAWG